MKVEKAIGQMKSTRAGGPMELVGEIICAAGQGRGEDDRDL